MKSGPLISGLGSEAGSRSDGQDWVDSEERQSNEQMSRYQVCQQLRSMPKHSCLHLRASKGIVRLDGGSSRKVIMWRCQTGNYSIMRQVLVSNRYVEEDVLRHVVESPIRWPVQAQENVENYNEPKLKEAVEAVDSRETGFGKEGWRTAVELFREQKGGT